MQRPHSGLLRLVLRSALLLLALTPCRCPAAPVMRVMTYNIRYDNPADGADVWANRRDFVASLIRYHRPQIIGTQEALRNQLADLSERLPAYHWCGAGRDDGHELGEYCAIFYDTTAIRRLRDSTFWLSPTPALPSKGWDAALNRICTWAEFADRETGQRFVVMNTHFDHLGEQARAASAELLKAQASTLAGPLPVIVLGDFNATPADAPITILLDQARQSPPALLLADARAVTRTQPHGPPATFQGFDVHNPRNQSQIDFIFVRIGMSVLAHATLTDFKPDLRFPSDHLPVIAEIELGPSK